METGTYVKPPWVLARTAWQRPAQRPVTQILSDHLVFSDWYEKPSESLIQAKDRISHLESARRWELVKKMANPYEIVYTHEDKQFHPSLAIIKPLSRSYFKMIEMADVLEFFEHMTNTQSKIRTAHVAEGPGGFIQGIVDLCERKKKTLQIATAMTLKSSDQRVPGWRRASTFLHHHREVRLHYGADETGDIYNVANQDSFVKAVEPGVHFFTADGGFDFSINYSVQEKAVFRILVCSATVGLRCLLPDGSLVLKVFESFSPATELLIVLLGRCFKEWMLYKPALSRPCNSERYFLGRGFNRLSPQTLQVLMAMQSAAAEDKYPRLEGLDISEPERAYLDHNSRKYTLEQETAIQKAEQYANHPEVWYSTQLPHDFRSSLLWCEKFHVPYKLSRPAVITAYAHPAEYTCEPVADQQSPSPGGGSVIPAPSDPAS